MTTTVDQDRAIAALADVWGRLDELLAGLDDRAWSAPTALPGWDVRCTVAHVIGTESMLLGRAVPDVEIDPAEYAHVRNDMGRINEAWVASMAGLTPAELLERFRDHTARRLDALRAMGPEQWEKEDFTPAGRDTYGRFMRIRVFDCWVHEQDIRDAVGRPGGESGPAAEMALEEMAASMGYVVGKRAGAPAGSRVTFALTGPVARTINVDVAERAAVVDELPGPATVTLTMPAGVFARLGGGRIDAATAGDQVGLDGDAELGERILANLAYTV